MWPPLPYNYRSLTLRLAVFCINAHIPDSKGHRITTRRTVLLSLAHCATLETVNRHVTTLPLVTDRHSTFHRPTPVPRSQSHDLWSQTQLLAEYFSEGESEQVLCDYIVWIDDQYGREPRSGLPTRVAQLRGRSGRERGSPCE